MAASERQLQRYIYSRNSRLHICYSDVMLKGNKLMNIFSSQGFGEKCEHTELALNFIQKQYFS